ncbi:MAG: tRNA guanosine(34) transglycosylase Tgt [Acidobacteria bacterium]|nr:tRNA guanosine(34) transglycosylase Tgt [Acidobacteriota bacterium]
MIRYTLEDSCADSAARTGRLETPHGVIETPAFMAVGTYGSVKGLRSEDLESIGAQVVLSNAYHLWERPGLEVIRAVGGLHRFMGWERPILTDSGGYQVMSLSDRREIDDDGVTFQSPLDGQHRRLTPETVIEIQATLGVDLAMVLDECVASPAPYETAAAAVERSQNWAERSRPLASTLAGGLLGIVQGSVFPELRRTHAERLVELDFDAYAIGGLAVGESKEQTWEAVEAAIPALPRNKLRYVMGMGYPADLVEAVARGVDLFDCVIPTRHARNGMAFTSMGTIVIRHARYAADPEPLDPTCGCPVCGRYSRAYLRHLKLRGEMLGGVLMTLHNLWHYLDTMGRIRHAIASGEFAELRASVARDGAPSGQE